MSSTAHFIFGSFYDTWRNADRLGFRRYRWSIAKHISEADEISSKDRNWDLLDNVLVKDRNPKHWKPAVWWITQDDIEMLREGSSNAEWLVEALGGISRGSGLVFSPKDLKSCICNRCGDDKECKPYQENYCKLIEEFKLGDKLQHITERKCGVDFGGRVPNAQVIVGRHGKMIFVLFADEVLGLSQDEVVDWIDKPCKKLKVWEIYADPEERGMVWILESKGYAMPELWAFGGGGMKKVFVSNAKRWIERHNAIIPKAFVKLIESLQQMAWNEKGKIIKHNDHAISGDSEILTKEGWKNYITLTYSDKIATRNPETGELEYQYPTDIMIRNWDGDMYKFKNHSISFMVSPNHNMAFTHQCDYIKKRNKIDVSKIPNLPQNIFIPKTATWKGKNKQFIEIPSQSNHPRHKKIGKLSMDAFLAFLGLWLAEGCVSKSHYQVIIDQNKLREQKVKDIFNNLGLKYHSWNMGKNVVRYAIQSIDLYIFFKKFGKSHDKFIPNWVFNLSKRQLQILFDSMMFGDGSKQKCYWHYDTVSQKLADDFQKLLLHLGFCGNIYNLKYNGSKSFRISIWKSKNAQIHKREIKKTHYKGKIYCVDVPNHIIYVRQNGKPMWTGNSFDGFIYAISDFDISGGIEQLYEVKKREINRIW
uniref:Putative homing endonuclease n=2 Tax=viral metagenome TaxID=1070528 RepID=A0A6M3XMQ4_9ZZZZ